jgi:hypothetical protein
MEFLILFWIVCGIGAAFVASNRGASGCLWAFLGFLLGPIGFLMAVANQSDTKCPRCQRGIPKAATRCPECQADLRPPADAADKETRAGRRAGDRHPPIGSTPVIIIHGHQENAPTAPRT